MKLRQAIVTLALLPLVTAASQLPFEAPAFEGPAPPRPLSTTLVDLLSSTTNHTLLLRAFQRARLVPFLNRLNGSTLLAPSDGAILRAREREEEQASLAGDASATPGVWTYALSTDDDDDDDDLDLRSDPPRHDNLQLELRDTLLYHLLNFTLLPPPPPPSNRTDNGTLVPTVDDDVRRPVSLETLYHPSISPYNKSFPYPPSLPGSPRDEPDPDRPKPLEGLLRGHGQQLRFVFPATTRSEMGVALKGKRRLAPELVGTDWQGQGGVSVQRDSARWVSRGMMLVLDDVLERPKDLATQIRTNPSLSTLASLMPSSLLDYASTASHLTIFAPTNDAWGQLSPLELQYLQSGFAEKDLVEIFGDAASVRGTGDGQVGYLDNLLGRRRNVSSTVETYFDSPLDVEPVSDDPLRATVNGTLIETPDILASNGVLHTVPSLLLPSGSLSLTAEKFLLVLNATRFVSLLRSVNLSHYVQVPSGIPSILPSLPGSDSLTTGAEAYTILAPQDNVVDAWLEQAVDDDRYRTALASGDAFALGASKVPEPGSAALKALLEYHIVAGKWTVGDLKDGMLVGTELRGDSLKGARQRLIVNVQSAEIGLGRSPVEGWKKKATKPGGPKDEFVAFGGASVVADPVQVGKSIIYLLGAVLEPPGSLVTTAVSDLRLSTFVASIYAAGLDKSLARASAVTYLVPSNDAFASLSLVMSYLLLPTARTELRSVLRYHAIDEVVYLDDFPVGGSERYPTLLNGDEIYVERSSANASLAVHGPTVGGLPANGETRDGVVVEGNVLTDSGVIHLIDQVELPPNLDIGISKLLKGARANTMADLIRAANMSWVLDGTSPAPPEPDEAEEVESQGLGHGRRHKKKKRPRTQPRISSHRRAYTILCPTDKALSRLNLSFYLSNPSALSELVQLHIVPTDAFAGLPSDGRPLPLADEASFPTLLDKSQGGSSPYGQVAFRRWGDDGWLIGIKSARGTSGQTDSARVVAYGRASPWFYENGTSTRLAGGGGVLTIDSVLIPYPPNWFRRWGWIVMTVVLGTVVAACLAALVYKMWQGKKTQYERLEGEED